MTYFFLEVKGGIPISAADYLENWAKVRPGEKLHEQMISTEDSYSTYEYSNYYKILPQINNWGKDRLRIKKGKKVPKGFIYSSDNNSKWMTKLELKTWVETNKKNIGNI